MSSQYMRKRLYHGRVTALSNSVDIVQTGSPWQQGNITVDFVAGFSVTNALTIWHTSSAVSHNKRYSSIAALTLKAHNYQLLIYIWGQRSHTVNLWTLVPPSELLPTVTHAVVYSPYLILMSDRGWIHNALHNSFHNSLHNALQVVFSILTSGCSSDDPSFYRNLTYFLPDHHFIYHTLYSTLHCPIVPTPQTPGMWLSDWLFKHYPFFIIFVMCCIFWTNNTINENVIH